jgi:hypothetical protein
MFPLLKNLRPTRAADDWSLLREAAVTATHNLTNLCISALSPLCLTDAQLFSEQLHPIFLLAEVEEYHPVLAAVGCDDAELVVSALRRLITDGSRGAAQVCTLPLVLCMHSTYWQHRWEVAM